MRLTDEQLSEIEEKNHWSFDWGSVRGGGAHDRDKYILTREIRELWKEREQLRKNVEQLYERHQDSKDIQTIGTILSMRDLLRK